MDEISAILLTVVGHGSKDQYIYHNRYNVDGRKEKKYIITTMGGLEGCKGSWEALKNKFILTEFF